MRKLLFILSVGVLILGIIFFFIFFQTQEATRVAPIQPTQIPSNNSFPAPTHKTEPLAAIELIKKLPYMSQGFNIEYLSIPEVVMITIKEAPVETQKQAALTWIERQGFNPEDFNIRYNIYPYLQ